MKGVSLAAGLNQAYVFEAVQKGKTGKVTSLAKVAAVLGKDLDWLMTGVEEKTISASGKSVETVAAKDIFFVEEAAAGRWLESEDTGSDIPRRNPARYPFAEDCFAYKVVGRSIDQVFQHGEYAICVNYNAVRSALRSGDLVVIERRRAGLLERTIKRLNIVPGACQLWPQSSDPKFQDPLIVRDDMTADDGSQVKVLALVIGKYTELSKL